MAYFHVFFGYLYEKDCINERKFERMKGLSIVIPYYKGYDFIFNCIDSLLTSYNSSQKEILFEIIVIIDSPDEYKEPQIDIASHYGNPDFISIVVNDCNKGVAVSRNKGLALSKYDFVTFIDQDDYVLQNYFDKLSDSLDDKYHCILINGYWYYKQKNLYRKLYYIRPDLSYNAVARKTFCFWSPGLLILNKKKVRITTFFIDVSDKYKGCDDWAAILNMVLKYSPINFLYIKTPVFIINRHDTNFSNNEKQMRLCQIAAFEYFRNLVDKKKQKILDKRIETDKYRFSRKYNPLSVLDILRSYKKAHLLFLFHKWGYLKYPVYKIRKTLDELTNNKWIKLTKCYTK
jgi:glycosyltransferase involved in cell wall biosynthesis